MLLCILFNAGFVEWTELIRDFSKYRHQNITQKEKTTILNNVAFTLKIFSRRHVILIIYATF